MTAVGDDWIELSAVHCAEGSDIPQEGDVVCQLGDISDPDYQSAIVLSAFGDGAPYLIFYQGIDSYSLSGKDIFTIGYDSVKKECFIRGYGRMYFGDRERTTYIEYTKENGLQVRARKFLLESGEEVGEKISAMEGQISLKVGKDQLKATGIDIDSKTVTVTAQTFFVSSTSGTPIAVFTTDSKGNPIVKAQYIDTENLQVKHLNGADGTFSGELKAVTGTYNTIKATSGYDSMTLTASIIHFSNQYVDTFIGADVIDASVGGQIVCPIRIAINRPLASYLSGVNTCLHLSVEGAKSYDNAISTGNHALYIEKGGILGFRPRTRRIDSKAYPTGNVDLSHLDTNIIVLERRTLNLPKTNLQNGQMLFVRNHTNNDQCFIYGRISLGSSQADKYTTITLNGGEMAVLIYDEVNNIWTANKLGHF